MGFSISRGQLLWYSGDGDEVWLDWKRLMDYGVEEGSTKRVKIKILKGALPPSMSSEGLPLVDDQQQQQHLGDKKAVLVLKVQRKVHKQQQPEEEKLTLIKKEIPASLVLFSPPELTTVYEFKSRLESVIGIPAMAQRLQWCSMVTSGSTHI